ncbi:MAG: hypothetical protein HGA45_18145 [Chloroflexales bacterium]|nr:hypothetical protein [Chloroflexales bacterium]
MYDAESHEMELRGVDEAGFEEWYCPSCGRHFLMRWPPDYTRSIIAPGDEHVTHVGGKGGLRMGPLAITSAEHSSIDPAPPTPDLPISDHIDALWRKVLDTIELDDDLDTEGQAGDQQ